MPFANTDYVNFMRSALKLQKRRVTFALKQGVFKVNNERNQNQNKANQNQNKTQNQNNQNCKDSTKNLKTNNQNQNKTTNENTNRTDR